MATLLDYTLADTTVANPDGTRQAAFSAATVVAGPGDTALGHYDKAIALGSGGKASVDLSGLAADRTRFCVDVVFSAAAVPGNRQVLIDNSQLPFTLAVTPGASAQSFAVEARVKPGAGAKGAATTAYALDLHPNTWYTATLVYDTDTIGVYVDRHIQSVHAFPAGALAAGAGDRLTIGALDRPVLTVDEHFDGSLAAVRWQDDIPAELETQLDDLRAGAEWHISYKYESLPAALDLGRALDGVRFDPAPGAYVQHYDNGLIMCEDGSGVAFEMHGDIWRCYLSLVDTSPLGYLASDEMDSRKPGGRKNIFSSGGIYWSPATGAVPVVGHLYLDYERLGEANGIGFPTALAHPVAGGLEQVFQGARMYLREGGTSAHEVHGDILGHFLATGGTAAWGFPITDESDVVSNGHPIGRFNEFEGATIYWSAATGAHEVHGDIRVKYQDLGGPGGALGFPTSDEGDIPGAAAPARYNTFQNGSLLWFGSFTTMIHAMAFQLYFGRVDTVESEGFAMGQNDLYWRLTVKHGGSTVFNERFPGDGDFGGHDVLDWDLTVPVTIVPNTTDDVSFTLDVWESDDGAPFGGGDDHLGTWNMTLRMADGWGLRTNNGILNSGSFSDINNITASVKPQVDPASLTAGQKWWGVQNQGTNPITYPEYAAAFEDVDEQPEDWDVTDWLDKAFYSAVVEGIASGGNCFGMSLEGINALKNRSLFSLPLDRFTDWNTVVHEFNVKHCYQVGAGPIWWFVGEFLSGRTHDPKDVFQATAAAHARGDNPVLCLAQNADFSGAPHCIMPIAWNTSVTPWEMTVCDPNFVATTRTLYVDPNANTFHYDGGNVYNGTSNSGGRLHYMSYDLLCSPQHTPIWEAILLLIAGTILVLGSDTQTAAITDAKGNDLDAFGDQARQIAAGKGTLDDHFFSVKGFREGEQHLAPIAGKLAVNPVEVPIHLPDGPLHLIQEKPDAPIAGELLLRRGRSIQDVALNRRPPTTVISHLPIGTLLKTVKALQPTAAKLAATPEVTKALAPRTVHSALADPALQAVLSPETVGVLKQLPSIFGTEDFVHHVRGSRNGTFDWAVKRGLSEIHVSTPIGEGELTTVQVSGLPSSKAVLSLTAEQSKVATVRIEHKLGVAADRISIVLSDLPLNKGSDLQVNAKPGLGGVEVLAGGAQAMVAVSVDAVVQGRTVTQRFNVPMQDGVRLSVAAMLNQPTGLPVAQINALFGPALARAVVPAIA